MNQQAGRQPAAEDEVDSVQAVRRSVHIGDEFGLMGQTFRVVGLSEGTTTWLTSYVFMWLSEAQRLFGLPSAVSREYGVLKAVGARNRFLYRIVAVQALVAALPGALAGIALAALAAVSPAGDRDRPCHGPAGLPPSRADA